MAPMLFMTSKCLFSVLYANNMSGLSGMLEAVRSCTMQSLLADLIVIHARGGLSPNANDHITPWGFASHPNFPRRPGIVG